MNNPIEFLVILHPKALANLAVKVGTKHSHQILLFIHAQIWFDNERSPCTIEYINSVVVLRILWPWADSIHTFRRRHVENLAGWHACFLFSNPYAPTGVEKRGGGFLRGKVHSTYVIMSVSYHRRLACLINRLFRRRSKKTSKFRVTGLCEGNPPVTCGPVTGPVTWQMFPFDDVIMAQGPL